MAVSSVHKPGWRSRRRSRLSLVERAVPRLGRISVPDEGANAARSDDTPKRPSPPSELQSQAEISASAAPKTGAIDPAPHDDTAAPADAGSTALADQDDAFAADMPKSAPKSVDETSSAPRSIEYVGESPASAVELTASQHGSILAEAASDEDVRERDGVVLPAGPPDAAIPDTQPLSNPEARPMDAPVAPPGSALPVTVAAPSMPATSAAGDEATETRSSAQASSTLALDWDRLIDSGFTDPRDRSRPLPKNMDDIIRALVRQALSDQSSWRDRVILVTSPNERVGKTTAAINFVFGLTTVGDHRAVLVDVDTTGAGGVDRLGGGERTGIAQALADESVAIGDLVIRTDLDRLTLVASGAEDEDTLDRFASRRMLQILRHLTEDPEAILVIDAPPILASQEAAVLSVIAGQVVLAVEAGRTTSHQIEHALQRIGDRHNVSLVLHQSSGVVERDESSAAAQNGNDPETAGRRVPSIKRRMPRTAAAVAAGALALGLFVLQPTGQAGSTARLAVTHAAFSAKTVVPPQRWSSETGMTLAPSRQVNR